MINNKEIGVLYDTTNADDQEIYSKVLEYIKFIEQNSNDKPFGLHSSSVSHSINENKIELNDLSGVKTAINKVDSGSHNGFCIRTGIQIPFKVEKPMTYEAYKSWNKFADGDYEENFCHFSGEPSNGETSVNRPILKKNWKKAKALFKL